MFSPCVDKSELTQGSNDNQFLLQEVSNGRMRTRRAMNPATAMLLGSSCASFEKGTTFSLVVAVDSCMQVQGYHANKSHSQSCWGTCTFLFTLYTPLGTYLLSGRSTTVWKRDPVTATISGKLFSLLSFRAGWEEDRLRACASSRLTSFIGRETEGRVRLFTTDALSEKQETTFQPRVKRDKSKKSMSLFDWNISCRGRKGAAGVARAGRGVFCQLSLPSTQQHYPPECTPSRVQARQPKSALQRLAASAVYASV